jgi:isocitrate dehydrogenase
LYFFRYFFRKNRGRQRLSSGQEAADVIEKALEESFADGRATNDLARFMPGGKALPTSVFAKEITEKIQKK